MGTLELLCGPSGVGKTSSLESAVKSYRWTTRPRREREIDSREYDGTQTTHGFFVSEEEFLQRSDLVGVHRYPNPKTGEWYGFPKDDMLAALNRGEDLSEQIVAYRPIEDIVQSFSSSGVNVRTLLILSSFAEIKKRIKHRDGDVKGRVDQAVDNIKLYLDNRDKFSGVGFSFPDTVKGEKANEIIEETIAKLERGEIPDDMYEPLSVFAQYTIVMEKTKEGRIKAALDEFRRLKGTGANLVRNYFMDDPNLGCAFRKIHALRMEDDDSVARTYANLVGIAFLISEIKGMEETGNELSEIEGLIYELANSGEISTPGYKRGSIYSIFTGFYDKAEEVIKLGGKVSEDDIDKLRKTGYETYRAIKDLSFYFRIGMERSRRVISGDDPTIREIANAMIFARMLQMSSMNFFSDQRMQGKALYTGLNFWASVGKNTCDPDFKKFLLSAAEFDLQNSLSNQTRYYGVLLDVFTKRVISGRDDLLGLYDQYTVPNLPLLDMTKEKDNYTQLTAIAVDQFYRFVKELGFIYRTRKDKDPTPTNSFFPTILEPKYFVRQHYTFEVPDLGVLVTDIKSEIHRTRQLISTHATS